MPKYLRTFLAAVAAACAVVPATGTSAASAAGDKAIYDRIVSLAGDWSGHMEDPLAGPPVTVHYEIVSGGKAVIEYQYPAGSLPSVTVYFLASGKLRAVQYSPAGNQPAYKLGDDSTADLVQLDFDGGTGFDADHDGHVHKGEIRFVSPERIEQRWFHYVGPKEQGVTHWFLERDRTLRVNPEAMPTPVPKDKLLPPPQPVEDKR
ncbi:MAG TPA: hypothetical protein VFU77_03735 [Steroidobacteraceae bacterium]|nr:hypothetical protein [Steroidobacteraceae bacterium]